MSLLDATLTLPGIAGIVLTVGMAVDANVLIFSRIREELKRSPPAVAIQAGYDRAFLTILDANVTTLFVALILYAIGSGPVGGLRGDALHRHRHVDVHRHLRLQGAGASDLWSPQAREGADLMAFELPTLDFMGHRKTAAVASALLVIVTIVALALGWHQPRPRLHWRRLGGGGLCESGRAGDGALGARRFGLHRGCGAELRFGDRASRADAAGDWGGSIRSWHRGGGGPGAGVSGC